jgi:hypothetical protein
MIPFDPLAIALVVLGGGLLIAVGLVRRDRLTVIALTVSGFILTMLALRWAISTGDEATYAVLAAGIGASLATMGTERSRHARVAIQTDARRR